MLLALGVLASIGRFFKVGNSFSLTKESNASPVNASPSFSSTAHLRQRKSSGMIDL